MRFAQNDQTGSSRSRIAFAVLGFIFFIVASGSLIREYNSRVWSGIGRFSVLDIKNKVLKSVDPRSGEAVRLILPVELDIDTLDGRGRWSIEAIEEKSVVYGRKWMEDSIGDYLGIMGVVSVENFSFVDRVRWILLNRSARYRDIELDKTAFVANKKAIDEADVLGLGAIWEASVREYFVSYELANEKLELKVVNTTQTPGLASRAARLLDIVGISVEKIESVVDLQVENCSLSLNREVADLRSVKFIKETWGCDIELTEGNNATLFLGDKLAERYRRAD